MALVLTKRYCCVLLVDDQGAVEEFAADSADEAFGDGVGPGCPHRLLMMRMSAAVKTASNAAVNLASRSRIRNRKTAAGVVEVQEVAAVRSARRWWVGR